jgi:soluble lytic murein transglycosylase-like protein
MGDELSRKTCIQNNMICLNFVVSDNPSASGKEPLLEAARYSQVNIYSAVIDWIAAEKGVDARLVKAIMYMETTHGYYDGLIDWTGKNKSIRPMNINVDYWGNTFGSREDMNDPIKNIRAGVEMLSRIQLNLPGGSIEKIATLYNNINAIRVSDYGMRVKMIYLEQSWLPNVGTSDDKLEQMKLVNGLRGL